MVLRDLEIIEATVHDMIWSAQNLHIICTDEVAM